MGLTQNQLLRFSKDGSLMRIMISRKGSSFPNVVVSPGWVLYFCHGFWILLGTRRLDMQESHTHTPEGAGLFSKRTNWLPWCWFNLTKKSCTVLFLPYCVCAKHPPDFPLMLSPPRTFFTKNSFHPEALLQEGGRGPMISEEWTDPWSSSLMPGFIEVKMNVAPWLLPPFLIHPFFLKNLKIQPQGRFTIPKVLVCCDSPSPGRAKSCSFLILPKLCLWVSIWLSGLRGSFCSNTPWPR